MANCRNFMMYCSVSFKIKRRKGKIENYVQILRILMLLKSPCFPVSSGESSRENSCSYYSLRFSKLSAFHGVMIAYHELS